MFQSSSLRDTKDCVRSQSKIILVLRIAFNGTALKPCLKYVAITDDIFLITCANVLDVKFPK